MKNKRPLMRITIAFSFFLSLVSCSTSQKNDKSETKISLDSIIISSPQKKYKPNVEKNDSGQAVIVADRLHPFTNNYAVITYDNGGGYTDGQCRDGLTRSSGEASVMGVEQRGQVIQYHNIKQLARG